MEIFLPICFAYICTYIHTMHMVCVDTKEVNWSHGKQLWTFKEKPPNTELKSNQSQVHNGFVLALLSQVCLCECFSCGPPTTYKTTDLTSIQGQSSLIGSSGNLGPQSSSWHAAWPNERSSLAGSGCLLPTGWGCPAFFHLTNTWPTTVLSYNLLPSNTFLAQQKEQH